MLSLSFPTDFLSIVLPLVENKLSQCLQFLDEVPWRQVSKQYYITLRVVIATFNEDACECPMYYFRCCLCPHYVVTWERTDAVRLNVAEHEDLASCLIGSDEESRTIYDA